MSYSTTNEIALEVCKTIGADPEVRFVRAMRRGGKTYVTGTLGKPEEWRWLERKCLEQGYVFIGPRRA